MEDFLGLIPFAALHIFLIACMIVKFSENHYMAAIYNSSMVAKAISGIGMIGWWIYCALCADWIANSFNLEFNGWVGFGITAALMGILATGDWGPEYSE